MPINRGLVRTRERDGMTKMGPQIIRMRIEKSNEPAFDAARSRRIANTSQSAAEA